MDYRLIEVTGGNDLDAFLFCIRVLEKESEKGVRHYSHLVISGNIVYGANLGTIRGAQIDGAYEDGLYRVFKKDKKDVVLWLTDHTNYPIPSDFLTPPDSAPIAQNINIAEDPFMAQAVVVGAIQGKEVYNAAYLKDASGVYDIYMKERNALLYNPLFQIGLAPIQRQDSLPGM